MSDSDKRADFLMDGLVRAAAENVALRRRCKELEAALRNIVQRARGGKSRDLYALSFSEGALRMLEILLANPIQEKLKEENQAVIHYPGDPEDKS